MKDYYVLLWNYLFFHYLHNKIRSLLYSGLCWYLILMCFSKLRRKIINFSCKFYTHRVFLILAKRFSYHYLPNFIQYFGEKVKLDITILSGEKSRTLLFMRDKMWWMTNELVKLVVMTYDNYKISLTENSW